MLENFPEADDYPPCTRAQWDDRGDNIYNFAVEDARRSLEDGSDIYSMLGCPVVASRFGLDEDATYDVQFSFEGRGGKHLCVTRFEGHDLSGVDLAAELQGQAADKYCGPHDVYTNDWCRKLCAMMFDWSKRFTPRTASAEVNFQIAYAMMNLCEE
jgi:hypothetical protein